MSLSFSKKRKQKHSKLFILYLSIGLFLGTAFSLYLSHLYDQLTQAFSHTEEFTPTQVYSNITRVEPGQTRTYLLSRLKSLGYTPSTHDSSLEFNLHPINYPLYLLPEQHPILSEPSPRISLHFEGTQPQSSLLTLEINHQPANEIYLEPELVATLTRSGSQKKEIRTYMAFEDIPAPIWKAIIAIEDQHFLEHKGFDPRGLARALWVNIKTRSFAQGGSTITQQLVKNLMARRGKNVFRKINELFLSLMLEVTFDKEKILERYLNEVYLGQVGSLEVHGVAEGAKHFFGKKVEDLNLAEIALLAGLIRGPGYYSPYRYKDRAIERQRLVLKKMKETHLIGESEEKLALHQPLRLAPPQTTLTKAPYFTDYVKADLIEALKNKMSEELIIQSGLKVYTTLDPYLNAIAQKAVTQGMARVDAKNPLPAPLRLEGALASVDNTTGSILALVGGKNYAQSNFNRILNMKRQIGSTFKPLVYLAAFEKETDPAGVFYGPGHPAFDGPWTLNYDRNQQKWAPKNYEKGYQGWISFRTALSQSINTVAARLGYEVGLDRIATLAKKLGARSELPLYPALSLGIAELSPLELLQIYTTLANRGVRPELNIIRGIEQSDGTTVLRTIPSSERVVDEALADLITEQLKEVFESGTAKSARTLGFHTSAAGKTGTTSHYRDAWFVGYHAKLTTVVWSGLDQAQPDAKTQFHLTGASSALPIWVDFMKGTIDSTPKANLPQSPNLVDVPIDLHTGKRAAEGCPPSQVIIENYIRGKEPQEMSCEPKWPNPPPSQTQES